jgi:hypothetical protein
VRVRNHRSGADAGTSGISSSSRPATRCTRALLGTLAASVSETWIPSAASRAASETISPEGARTITPTSGRAVLTWTSSWMSSTPEASAVTSSVDIIQEPTPSSSSDHVAAAASRIRQRGIARTRRGACSTASAAPWRSATGPESSETPGVWPAGPKLART